MELQASLGDMISSVVQTHPEGEEISPLSGSWELCQDVRALPFAEEGAHLPVLWLKQHKQGLQSCPCLASLGKLNHSDVCWAARQRYSSVCHSVFIAGLASTKGVRVVM